MFRSWNYHVFYILNVDSITCGAAISSVLFIVNMEKSKKAKKFEYHADGDVFYIYNNDNNEETVGSLPVGNLVFDVGTSGKIIGIEIDNASELFGVEPSKIASATNTHLGVRMQGNVLLVHFSIAIGTNNFQYSYVIPKANMPICVAAQDGILDEWYYWLQNYYDIACYKTNFKDDIIEQKLKELRNRKEKQK